MRRGARRSEQSVGLLAGVEAVEHAHGPEKAASLAALIEAMNAIQAKVLPRCSAETSKSARRATVDC